MAREHFLSLATIVNSFLHDTSAEKAIMDILAAQKFGEDVTYMATILGSWFMDRISPGAGQVATIDDSLFGHGILGQANLDAVFSPAALTGSGEEYHMFRDETIIPQMEFTEDVLDDGAVIAAAAEIIRNQRLFVMHGRGGRVAFASQFPGSKWYGTDQLIIDPDNELSSSAAYAYAAAMLMTIAPKARTYNLLKVPEGRPYIIAGGPADKPTALMFSSMLPNNPVYRIIRDGKVVTDVGDIGVAVAAMANMQRKPFTQMDIGKYGFKLGLL